MRAYMNNTNERVTYKVWTISPVLVTTNNIKSLASNGIKASLLPNDTSVVSYNGQQYRYSSHWGRVEFETTCDEQELMLKLMYGTDLILLTVSVVEPHSIMHSDYL